MGCFYRAGKYLKDQQDDKGVSLVLAHTEKGRAAVERLEKRAPVRELPPDALHQYNPSLAAPPHRPKNRERFYELLSALPFDKAVSRCAGPWPAGIISRISGKNYPHGKKTRS